MRRLGCLLLVSLAATLPACASSTSNALRNTYAPVALQGQSAEQTTADSEECRQIGHRAGQGLDFATRGGPGTASASGDSSLTLVGGSAGRLAAGPTGGAAGAGAGIALGTFENIRQRGLYMHRAYQACMRARGYRGAAE